MDKVIAALLAWTVSNSGYPTPSTPPALEYRPQADFAAEVCPQEAVHCALRAYYRDGTGTIVLHEAHRRLEDARSRGLLVHEIVHYFQDLSGRWGEKSCESWIGRESEAYRLQPPYLVSQGASPFTLRMPILDSARCPADAHTSMGATTRR
jgi:hypothetical protein